MVHVDRPIGLLDMTHALGTGILQQRELGHDLIRAYNIANEYALGMGSFIFSINY